MIVKDYVREHKRRTREMFVPLVHPPGHAQCDFGEAWAVVGGVKRRVHFFVLTAAILCKLSRSCGKKASGS